MTEQDSNTQQPMRPALRRSSSDRVISGVCGGLARTLGVDPIVIRVIVAILALLGGTGIAAYIIAWILIPDDAGSSAFQRNRDGNGRFTQFLLVVVLAIAGISLLDVAWPGKSSDSFGFFLFLLIAVVAWQAFGHGSWGRSSVTTDADGATTIVSGNGTKIVKLSDGGVEITKTREPKSVLGRIVWNALAVAVGIMLMLNYTDVTNLSGRTILAIAMVIVAVGLLVSAFIGRARGLIAVGLLIGLFMLPVSVNSDNSTGDRIWQPTSLSSTMQPFDLGVGNATLDLTTVVAGLPAGQSINVAAHVGAGQLTVIVPSTMNVNVHSKAGLGSVKVFDLPAEEGAGASLESNFVNTPTNGTVSLDLSVGIGQIEVRYA